MKQILEEIKTKLNGEIYAEIEGVTYSETQEEEAKVYRVIFYGDNIRARSVRLEEYPNGELQLHYAGFYSEAGVLETLQEIKVPGPEETAPE